jgi:hypothetical protein
MRTLRYLALLVLAPVLAMAVEVPTYTVRLQAESAGSGKARATISLADCLPGPLSLPLAFSAVENLRLEEAPTGTRLESSPRNGITYLLFTLPQGTPAKADLRFSFDLKKVFLAPKLNPGEKSTLPASSQVFKHAFVNTQDAVIGTYRLEFLFPKGLMAQAIREQLPKPAKAEVGPRVILAKLEGRQAAILQLNRLQQGDDTSMVVELVPMRRSLGWLLSGLALVGLYLFHFRDLVAKQRS